MKFFLQIKHWQLFTLIIGIPVAIEFFSGVFVFSADDLSSGIERLLKIFPILILLYAGFLFGWLWSVGVFLSKKLADDTSMPTSLFKGALIIPTIYILFICWFVGRLMWSNEMSELFIAENIGLILTAHIMSMICILFVLYFNAKALKSVELQSRARLGDYVGEFFLFWFFPIGLWFLQPRINKLLEERGTEGGDFV